VEPLESVFQHRAVDLFENVKSYVNDVIGSDADDVAIKRGVVELTERQPVGDLWITCRIAVSNDVRSVEELLMLESADCAVPAVGGNDALAERLLM
jgi:hypothetical protein